MSRTEPIRAWRIWRVGAGGRLESPLYGDPWPEDGAFTAGCPDHARPVGACGCGVYAVATREQAEEWAEWARSALPQPVVLGRVRLWGRVLPYSLGYRAQHAYPDELELLDDDPTLAAELRARYRVDVGRAAA